MDLGPEQPADGDAQLSGDVRTADEQKAMPAGMFRRMAALLYDSLAMVAVLMVATLPFLPFLHGRVLRPEEVGVLAYIYWAWEVIVVAGFFGFFWTRRGQTLGMQAWRLRVEDPEGRQLSWRLVLLRQAYAVLPWMPGFLMLSYADTSRRLDLQLAGEALLFIGVLSWTMMWFDAGRRTWHDRMSNTRVIVLAKKGNAQSW
jgi:uncharacterized RDD family membrane protein YckC